MVGVIINVAGRKGVIITPGKPRIRATFHEDELQEIPFSRRLIGQSVYFDLDQTPRCAVNVRPTVR